jgi:hypothetical protein
VQATGDSAVTSRRLRAAALLVAAVLASPAPAREGTEAAAEEEVGAEANPTRAILYSFREEFDALRGDAWQNVFTMRADAAIFSGAPFPAHARGILLRADLPVTVLHAGSTTQGGLGDLYGQALVVPRFSPLFLLPLGTGFIFPTATSSALGSGKFILAPAVIPAVLFPERRGLAYVKFQDWFSFAGASSRPSVHFLTVTPTILWRIGLTSWTLVDAESNTNWKAGATTWARVGFELGTLATRGHGLSLKVEVPFGGSRAGVLTARVVYYVLRR